MIIGISLLVFILEEVNMTSYTSAGTHYLAEVGACLNESASLPYQPPSTKEQGDPPLKRKILARRSSRKYAALFLNSSKSN